jgi:hypothetical protein
MAQSNEGGGVSTAPPLDYLPVGPSPTDGSPGQFMVNPYASGYVAPVVPSTDNYNYMPVWTAQNTGYTATPAPALPRTLTTAEMQSVFLNDPNYKQGLEWLNQANATNVARENQVYGLQSQYQQGSTWTPEVYTPETIPASYYAQIALQKEKAAHDLENQRKYQYELRYGTGNSGGQIGVDQGELTYNYDTMMKDLDLQKQAREEAVAQSNSRNAASVARSNASNSASIAQSNANQAISRQIDALQHTYKLEDYAQQLAISRDTLLNQITDYYMNRNTGIWFKDGVYQGPPAT